MGIVRIEKELSEALDEFEVFKKRILVWVVVDTGFFTPAGIRAMHLNASHHSCRTPLRGRQEKGKNLAVDTSGKFTGKSEGSGKVNLSIRKASAASWTSPTCRSPKVGETSSR